METTSDNFKFKIAQKNHAPLCLPSVSLLQGSLVTDNLKHSNSLVLGENGRKHYSSLYSDCEEFVPSMKLVPHILHCAQYSEKGKRLITKVSSGDNVKSQSKRHSTESLRRSSSTTLPVIGWHCKKTVSVQNKSEELAIETLMNRKKRIDDLIHQRNDIPVAALGDKSYYSSDREPGFHAQGGLVCGSTIASRKSNKQVKRSMGTTNGGKSLKGTYAAIVTQRDKEYEIAQVRTLTLRSEKQNQTIPSWEEKTGLWLVRPEDEND